jgi:hypothetical protein
MFFRHFHVPYLNANPRTPTKVEHAVTAQSTVHHDGSYVESATVDIDGLSLTPAKICLLKEAKRKHEFLHFDYVAWWESFRAVVISRQLFLNQNTSLPMHIFFFSRFTFGDWGHA